MPFLNWIWWSIPSPSNQWYLRLGHNYIGHNYIPSPSNQWCLRLGHNYMGHNYIGHNHRPSPSNQWYLRSTILCLSLLGAACGTLLRRVHRMRRVARVPRVSLDHGRTAWITPRPTVPSHRTAPRRVASRRVARTAASAPAGTAHSARSSRTCCAQKKKVRGSRRSNQHASC